MPKVKFLVNATPVYRLAYNKGDEAEVSDALAAALIEDKAAELVDEPTETKPKKKPTPEK